MENETVNQTSPIEMAGRNLRKKYRLGGSSKKGSHHSDNQGKSRSKTVRKYQEAPESKVMLMNAGTGHCVMVTREYAISLGYQLDMK